MEGIYWWLLVIKVCACHKIRGSVLLNHSCREAMVGKRLAFISCLRASQKQMVGNYGKQGAGLDEPLA